MSWSSVIVWTVIPLVSTLFLYYQLTKGIPSRRRLEQRPRSSFGVVAVDGVQQGLGTQLRADGVDVIFVHGLGSNPDTTWRARVPDASQRHSGSGDNSNVDTCWVTDFLVDEIPAASRRKTRIFFYNHDSFWQRDAVQTRLWNLAGNMLHGIQQRIRRTTEERKRNLVFVSHSYGGLLIKQALVRAKGDPTFTGITEQTKGILFLGTPHRGSSFTRIGSLVASLLGPIGSNALILSELVYDSLPLQDLHEQFMAAMGKSLQVYNFFEERETCIVQWGPLLWTKFCVEEQSAKYSGSTDHVQSIGLAVDHRGLNKFASRTDSSYGMIKDKLLSLLPPTQQDTYSVPLESVSSYILREELSQKIADILALRPESPSNAGGLQALVIHGMGGVGKTQLALRYIEEHRDQYGLIMWIDAHTTETVRFSFERIATALKLVWYRATAVIPDARLRDSPVVVEVMRWFSERDEADRPWLVLVDNADDTTWSVEEVIPHGPGGHVVVTSQHPQSTRFLNGQCTRLNVGNMTCHEARTLLRQHTRMETQPEPAELYDLYDQVAERLGCLALAVDLAGAYLSEQVEDRDRNSNMTESADNVTVVLREYLSDYNLHQDTLLRWEPSYRSSSSYEKTLWTVWNTSLAAIQKTSSQNSASCLLMFLAQFEGGQVQEEVFRLASLGWPVMVSDLDLSEDGWVPDWLKKMLGSSNGTWDSFEYRQAIPPLLRYGLVQRETGPWPGTTMHSLVQWRAGKEREQNGSKWEHWAWLFVMAAVYQTNRERSHPVFRRHMISYVRGMEMFDVDGGRSLGLDEIRQASGLVEVGNLFYFEGRWSEAEKLEVQVMETYTRVLGEEHPDTLTSISNLTSTYRCQGRLSEAEKLQIQVAETSKRVLGDEHPDTLTSIHDLALIYKHQGRLSEAEKLQEQEVKTSKRILGEEHPETLISMSNLASTISKDQERLPEAEKLQTQIAETKKRVLGEEHPQTLISISKLASTIFKDQERLSEAEELDTQIMEVRKRVLGEEHPDTLISMSNLAYTWKWMGRKEDAVTLMEQCVKISARKLGADHPDTIERLDTLEEWQSSIETSPI